MRHSKSRFIEDAQRVGTGAVKNRTYRVGLNAVRVKTAPTGGESVYLFLEFTIVHGFIAHRYDSEICQGPVRSKKKFNLISGGHH